MGRQKLDNSIGNDEYKDLCEINIIPLVDIMLVLLIIFMIATPLSISGIGVKLPTSKSQGKSVDQSKVIVSISQKGEYFIGKHQIKPENLETEMKIIYSVKEKKELYIRADKNVAYGKVVNLMSSAKLAGVIKISMLTNSPVSSKS